MIRRFRRTSCRPMGKAFWGLLASLLFFGDVSAKDWYPVEVDVWEPPFNAQRLRRKATYIPLNQASQRWNICVSIPHLKDSYWLAVNFGLVDEAKRLGINLAIYQAGGYERLDAQRIQIEECLAEGFGGEMVDGLILSAIDANGLNDMVADITARGIPVLDLINGINSPDIAARAAVTYYDPAYKTGEYLKRLESETTRDVKVAWFPGPEGAAWSAEGDAGFKAALADSNIRIIATRMGDTGVATQKALLEDLLEGMGDDVAAQLDYVVGTTVSAEAAVAVLRRRGLDSDIKVLAYYYGSGVNRGIRRGSIIAAPTDATVVQARMAVDMMVRILERQPYFRHAAPQIKVINQQSVNRWDSSTTLAPQGFRAMFEVGEN
ncbi:MAG: TMAO reductase system periplasmic protein TorT [Gammaproteobacteria bacterium]